MTDYPLVFALAIFAGSVVLGFVCALRWLAQKYARRIRHRMFDRIPPSRWPQVDYRVGSVCRPEDLR